MGGGVEAGLLGTGVGGRVGVGVGAGVVLGLAGVGGGLRRRAHSGRRQHSGNGSLKLGWHRGGRPDGAKNVLQLKQFECIPLTNAVALKNVSLMVLENALFPCDCVTCSV